jgi:DNA-binding transcriptional MocR family regulator
MSDAVRKGHGACAGIHPLCRAVFHSPLPSSCKEAIEELVAFVPGSPFYDDNSGQNTMRLNFSNASPEKIDEGIARLGGVIARALKRQPVLTSHP